MPYTSLWAQIPFVGRIEHLRRLSEHRGYLEGNRDRVRHVILVEGFDGVGKTALVDEFLLRFGRDEAVSIARGAYSPYLRRQPLAPLFEALDELCSDSFLRRRLLPLFTDQIYRPLIARLPLLAGVVGMEDMTPATGDAATLASLAATLLVHIARFRPVVIFLDDAHSMPEEEQQALVALNAGLRRAGVLIVLAIRRGPSQSVALASMLEPIIADRIYLPPLTTGEVSEMVTRLCGAKVSALLAGEIARLSAGSPLRVLEILRLLNDRGTLLRKGTGEWRLAPTFNGVLRIDEESTSERIDRLDESDRLPMLLLECAGGIARRDELAEWSRAMAGGDAVAAEESLGRLEANRLIRPVYARPEEVTFAHERTREEILRNVKQEDIDIVAAMIVRTAATRRELRRWCGYAPLLRSIFRQLPPVGSIERQELLGPFISLNRPSQVISDIHGDREAYAIIYESREHLQSREIGLALLHSVTLDHSLARFPSSTTLAGELYRLTVDEEECRDLKALAAAILATSRFYENRSTDVSELLEQAEGGLAEMSDLSERTYAEMVIARLRAMQVPSGMPREAIEKGRRAYFLFDRLGLQGEKYGMFDVVVNHAARARDEGQLRLFCTMLLKAIRDGERSLPFRSIFQAARSSILIGDIFQAREIFETWSSRSTPVGVHEFMLHAHLISLFAIVDAEPSLAADMALSGREEFIRFRATSKQTVWNLVYAYVALQAGLLTSLLAAGRHTEALTITEQMEKELGETNVGMPGAVEFLRLVRSWLLWRCTLPSDAPTSLCWSSSDTPNAGVEIGLAQVIESTGARATAEEFREIHRSTLTGLPPQVRFHAEMLLAQMESLEGEHDLALLTIERAAAACAEGYAWHFDLDSRAARITLRLRQVAAEPSRASVLLPQLIEEQRELYAVMTEKGLAARIARLTDMFVSEARRIMGVGRDIAAQLEKIGGAAHVAAHLVLRNSRSKRQGPIEHARLFLMGPLRLMRSYSYMELSETAFERETARTLLIALVAASVQGQRLTREELAMRIAPKARTPEQQKKALYNAASAARAACGSPGSILPVGSTSLELNINPEVEGSVWVDVIELVRLAKKGEELEAAGSITAAFEVYQQAMILASKGELASDCYSEWLDAARDHIRQIVRGTALAIGRIALRNGLCAAGIEAVSAQLTRDPFDEESHRMLIELYREGGNRTAALKQFEKCRAALMEEFGVEPERETQLLRRQLVAAD